MRIGSIVPMAVEWFQLTVALLGRFLPRLWAVHTNGLFFESAANPAPPPAAAPSD